MVSAKKICYIAVLTALTVVLSSFSIPVPGGHLYLNDTVICFAALAFDPFSAFIVGGIGAFLGDFFFYPAPMFVSLAAHGLQAIAISLIAGGMRKFSDNGEGKDGLKNKNVPPFWRVILALLTGAVIMVTGYTLGRVYVYGAKTWEASLLKLPFEILQAAFGVVAAPLLMYFTPLKSLFYVKKEKKTEKQAEADKAGEKSKTDADEGHTETDKETFRQDKDYTEANKEQSGGREN